MISGVRLLLEKLRQIEKDLRLHASDEVESVLQHIWARSVIAAPPNYFRKRWLLVLLLCPLQPFLIILAFFITRNMSPIKFAKMLLLIPFSLIIALIELVTDGFLGKRISKNWVKHHQRSVPVRLSIITEPVVISGIAFLQEPYLSQANSFLVLPQNSCCQDQKELKKKIDLYWSSL